MAAIRAGLEATLNDLRTATGNPALNTVRADFASLAEVAALSAQLRREFAGLRVLINNAGLLTDRRQLSVDGFELTFAVNVLARFLLTLGLLDTLKANAPARIVNVAVDGTRGWPSGFLQPAAGARLRGLAGLCQQQADERAVEQPSRG